MSKPVVVIKSAQGPYGNAMAVLESLELPDFMGKKVLLKPNAGRFVPSGRGITTHPQTVAAAMDFFLRRGANVILGDSPILGVKPLSNLEIGGYLEEARRRSILAIDVDHEPPLRVPVPNGRVLRELKVCAVWKQVDYVVSIPVMKTHMHTQLSLSLKNMKGLIWRREKVRLHQLPLTPGFPPQVKMLDVAIADVSTLLKPHLALIDGSVGLEGLGPSAGRPKPMDLAVGSTDYLAADAVAAFLMGFQPSRVHHLRLAAEFAGRSLRLSDFAITPADFRKLRAPFAKPPRKLKIKFKGLELQDKDSCSACLSTIFSFCERYQKELDYTISGKPLRMATGKAIEAVTDDTFLIGNCAIGRVKNGIAVNGCPPVPSQMLEAVKKHYRSTK